MDQASVHLSGKLEKALACCQQGHWAAAEAIYEEILKNHPKQFEALVRLGTLAGQAKNPKKALILFDKAIRVDPKNAVPFNNKGMALQDLNRWEAALSSYDRAIALRADYAVAYYNRGNVLKHLDRFGEALASYDQAIAIKRDFAEAHYARGIVLSVLEQREAALASYDRAVALRRDYAEAFFNRGNLLRELSRRDAAIASYDQAIAIDPKYAEACLNRGDVLHSLKCREAALASYEQAIAIRSDYAEAHSNRGNVLRELKQLAAALASYEQAIAIRPEFAEAHSNRGLALDDLKRFDAALASCERAIAIRPDFADAYRNRGDAQRRLAQYEAAVASYDEALALDPDLKLLMGQRRHAMSQICDWRGLDADLAQLTARIERGEAVSPPFVLLALSDSAALQRSAADIMVREYYPIDRSLPEIPETVKSGRLRIGYFSADYHDHATAHLIAGLFEMHDRTHFHVTAFSFGPDSDGAMRRRLKDACDDFVEVRDKSDIDVALLARRLKIDIAVDLKGFTQDDRTGIFALRAAPLQVSYLGYPGTMSAGYMDYLIADRVVVPEESQSHYIEKILYLPDCYQVNDAKRVIADGILSRAELGLPPTGFVFCCFNNNYKILPGTFDIWMRILRRVEGSVLWLLEDNPSAAANLRREATRRNVSAERLIFARRTGTAEHLARHRAAGLFLDTLPYNAHTTASDALWAGLPLLTCAGDAFSARVAASLLTAIDLPELIAPTTEAYEELAVELAVNPRRLAGLRQSLADNRLTAPLFNTALFTRHIEAGYMMIYERLRANLPPEHVYVEPRR